MNIMLLTVLSLWSIRCYCIAQYINSINCCYLYNVYKLYFPSNSFSYVLWCRNIFVLGTEHIFYLCQRNKDFRSLQSHWLRVELLVADIRPKTQAKKQAIMFRW